jgi:uncharacterized protein YidB (DUF937 family)
MSLFGSLLNQVLGNLSQESQNQILGHVSSLISQHGGIEGLAQKFSSAGLGGVFQSWVGTGQNQPVSGEQLQQVFGADHLNGIAQQMGVDPQHLLAGLSHILPNVVDKLTPDGQPVAGDALQQGLGALLQGGIGKLLG